MNATQIGSNEVLFKDATRRLVDFFAQHRVKISHTLALEGLTVAVGGKTYRQFRSLLQHAQNTAPAELEPGDPRWAVAAVYVETDEPFNDSYCAVDALGAAVLCQVERLSNEAGGEVEVTHVVDRTTGRIADIGHFGECEIASHGQAVRRLLDTAKDLLAMDNMLDVPTPAAVNVALSVLTLNTLLNGATDVVSALDTLTARSQGVTEHRCIAVKGYGRVDKLCPVAAIDIVSGYVQDAVQIRGWAQLDRKDLRDAYHARALATYFAPQLRQVLATLNQGVVEVAEVWREVDAGELTRPLTWCDVLNAVLDREAEHETDRIGFDSAGNSYVFVLD